MKIRKLSVGIIIVHILLLIWAFVTIYPIIWVLLNSFKPSMDVIRNSFSIPLKNFTVENYINVVGKGSQFNLLKGYLNSFLISGTVVIAVLIIAGFGSFGLARYEFKGKKLVYGFIVATMMLPIFSIIGPLETMMVRLNLNNKRLGVIIPQIAGNISFAVVILTGFMQQLPIEVEESAYMDGANVFQVLLRLVFPMAKSAFATTAIFVFLWSFNDLFLQMRMITLKDNMPIVVMLHRISADSKYGSDFGLKSAAAVLAILPVLITYLFLQKHIIKGLTAGAIKG